MNLAVCDPDVDVLHRTHNIVDKTLAVSTYNVDQGICRGGAIVYRHLHQNESA